MTNVLGIYLERSGATLVLAEAKAVNIKRKVAKDQSRSPHKQFVLEVLAHSTVGWSPNSTEETDGGLQYIRERLSDLRDDLGGVGLSCYGPFDTLTPVQQGATGTKEIQYGRLNEKTAPLPFRGVNLYEDLLVSGLGEAWLKANVSTIETDAIACAFGEAYAGARALLSPNQTFAFICVTEGIGLGAVRNGSAITEYLHPEIGSLHASVHPSDPLINRFDMSLDLRETCELPSVSQLADNRAIKARFEAMFPGIDANAMNIASLKVGEQAQYFWDFRAFYLAQVCTAVTVSLAPDQIAIGAQIDPMGNLAERTREIFRKIIDWRVEQGEPVFDYPAFRDDRFISSRSKKLEKRLNAKGLGYTGAMGMCWDAANRVLNPKTP